MVYVLINSSTDILNRYTKMAEKADGLGVNITLTNMCFLT